jgi:hypothetical protein
MPITCGRESEISLPPTFNNLLAVCFMTTKVGIIIETTKKTSVLFAKNK